MSGGGGSYRGRGFGQRPTSNGFGGSRHQPHPNLKFQNRRGNNRPGGDNRGPNSNRQQQWRSNNRFNNQSYQSSTFQSGWEKTSADYARSSSNDRGDRDRDRDRGYDRSRDRSDRNDRHYQNYRGRGGYRGSNNRYSGPGRPRGRSPSSSSSGSRSRSRSPSPKEPLPGSEAERQQKITETAAKLKKSISAITENEKADFWEQDLAEATALAVSIGEIDGKHPTGNLVTASGSELKSNPAQLKFTHNNFKEINPQVEDKSNKLDFDEFSLSAKEIDDDDHVVIDSVGKPDIDNFTVPQLIDNVDSSKEQKENTAHVSSETTVAPLEEPIDFANVMEMLGNVSDDDDDSILSAKLSKSKDKSDGSSYYDPILSTAEHKTSTSPVVAMCPPPSNDFTPVTPNLGYTPALGPAWQPSSLHDQQHSQVKKKIDLITHESGKLQPPPAFDPRKPLSLNVDKTDELSAVQSSVMYNPAMPIASSNPPVMIPSFPPFMPSVQMTYPAVPMPTPLPVPPIPFTPLTNNTENNSTSIKPMTNSSMDFDDDVFEEMQEAMEFAKLMSMDDKPEENFKNSPVITSDSGLESVQVASYNARTTDSESKKSTSKTSFSKSATTLPKSTSPQTLYSPDSYRTDQTSSDTINVAANTSTKVDNALSKIKDMDILKISQQILIDKHTTEDLLRHTQMLNANNALTTKDSITSSTISTSVPSTCPQTSTSDTIQQTQKDTLSTSSELPFVSAPITSESSRTSSASLTGPSVVETGLLTSSKSQSAAYVTPLTKDKILMSSELNPMVADSAATITKAEPHVTDIMPSMSSAISMVTSTSSLASSTVPNETSNLQLTNSVTSASTETFSLSNSAVPITAATLPLTSSTTSLAPRTLPLIGGTIPVATGTLPLTRSAIPLVSGSLSMANNVLPLATGSMPLSSATSSVTLLNNKMPLTSSTMQMVPGTIPLSSSTLPLATGNMPLTASALPLASSTLPLTTSTLSLASGTMPLVTGNTVNLAAAMPLLNAVVSNVQATNDVIPLGTFPTTRVLPKKPKKENVSETVWKDRVINRFLKMSKSEIRNMLNRASLRKFDIAMNHLVKERKNTINQEFRLNEDQRMKEYDREEFMNQLNAMLDPNASVDISNLPTEFIQHLSEVLHLDPLENITTSTSVINTQPLPITESTNYNEDLQSEVTSAAQMLKNLNKRPHEIRHKKEHKPVESDHHKEKHKVRVKIIRDDHKKLKELQQQAKLQQQQAAAKARAIRTTSTATQMDDEYTQTYTATHDYILREHAKPNIPKSVASPENATPVVNMADIDDIFSAAIARVRTSTKPPLPQPPTSGVAGKLASRIDSRNNKAAAEAQENRTTFNLDDIFSAGISRSKTPGTIAESRSSNRLSVTDFGTDVVERWMRKEREHIDAYRNLTKEEWDAKYGKTMDRGAFERELEVTFSEFKKMQALPNLNNEKNVNETVHKDSSESEQSSSSSSSDTEGETSSDVTQLLKVIKENEKIAKKKSFNETIRDEVAAEIERKWREKSKYKDKKSKKRSRRKKDKKERKKRGKRKHKKRSKSSSSSDSDSDLDLLQRLLTESEIKKEVKDEEPEVAATLAAVGGRTILFKNKPTNPKTAGIARPYPLRPVSQKKLQQENDYPVMRKVTFSDRVIQHEISDLPLVRKFNNDSKAKSLVTPAAIINPVPAIKTAPQSALKAAAKVAAKTVAAAAKSVTTKIQPVVKIDVSTGVKTITKADITVPQTTVKPTQNIEKTTQVTSEKTAKLGEKAATNVVAKIGEKAATNVVAKTGEKAATYVVKTSEKTPTNVVVKTGEKTSTNVVVKTAEKIISDPVKTIEKIASVSKIIDTTSVDPLQSTIQNVTIEDQKSTIAENSVEMKQNLPKKTITIETNKIGSQKTFEEMNQSIEKICKEFINNTTDSTNISKLKFDPSSLVESFSETSEIISVTPNLKKMDQPIDTKKTEPTTKKVDKSIGINKTESISKKINQPIDPTKPKKIDIKAYKARLLERQKKEKENLERLERNPETLTHDLLKLSTKVRSCVPETTQKQEILLSNDGVQNIKPVADTKPSVAVKKFNVKPAIKLKRTSIHERMKAKMAEAESIEKQKNTSRMSNLKANDDFIAKPLTSESSKTDSENFVKCAAGHVQTKMESNGSPKSKKKKKNCKVCEADINKFKNIKSEGVRELKLKSPKTTKEIGIEGKEISKKIDPKVSDKILIKEMTDSANLEVCSTTRKASIKTGKNDLPVKNLISTEDIVKDLTNDDSCDNFPNELTQNFDKVDVLTKNVVDNAAVDDNMLEREFAESICHTNSSMQLLCFPEQDILIKGSEADIMKQGNQEYFVADKTREIFTDSEVLIEDSVDVNDPETMLKDFINMIEEELEELKEKINREKIEEEKIKREKIEEERRKMERAEEEKIEREKIEEERKKMERAEEEKIEREKIEEQRRKIEKVEEERIEREKIKEEQRKMARAEEERIARERMEKEKVIEILEESSDQELTIEKLDNTIVMEESVIIEDSVEIETIDSKTNDGSGNSHSSSIKMTNKIKSLPESLDDNAVENIISSSIEQNINTTDLTKDIENTSKIIYEKSNEIHSFIEKNDSSSVQELVVHQKSDINIHSEDKSIILENMLPQMMKKSCAPFYEDITNSPISQHNFEVVEGNAAQLPDVSLENQERINEKLSENLSSPLVTDKQYEDLLLGKSPQFAEVHRELQSLKKFSQELESPLSPEPEETIRPDFEESLPENISLSETEEEIVSTFKNISSDKVSQHSLTINESITSPIREVFGDPRSDDMSELLVREQQTIEIKKINLEDPIEKSLLLLDSISESPLDHKEQHLGITDAKIFEPVEMSINDFTDKATPISEHERESVDTMQARARPTVISEKVLKTPITILKIDKKNTSIKKDTLLSLKADSSNNPKQVLVNPIDYQEMIVEANLANKKPVEFPKIKIFKNIEKISAKDESYGLTIKNQAVVDQSSKVNHETCLNVQMNEIEKNSAYVDQNQTKESLTSKIVISTDKQPVVILEKVQNLPKEDLDKNLHEIRNNQESDSITSTSKILTVVDLENSKNSKISQPTELESEESIAARLLEIDRVVLKLMEEKMKLCGSVSGSLPENVLHSFATPINPNKSKEMEEKIEISKKKQDRHKNKKKKRSKSKNRSDSKTRQSNESSLEKDKQQIPIEKLSSETIKSNRTQKEFSKKIEDNTKTNKFIRTKKIYKGESDEKQKFDPKTETGPVKDINKNKKFKFVSKSKAQVVKNDSDIDTDETLKPRSKSRTHVVKGDSDSDAYEKPKPRSKSRAQVVKNDSDIDTDETLKPRSKSRTHVVKGDSDSDVYEKPKPRSKSRAQVVKGDSDNDTDEKSKPRSKSRAQVVKDDSDIDTDETPKPRSKSRAQIVKDDSDSDNGVHSKTKKRSINKVSKSVIKKKLLKTTKSKKEVQSSEDSEPYSRPQSQTGKFSKGLLDTDSEDETKKTDTDKKISKNKKAIELKTKIQKATSIKSYFSKERSPRSNSRSSSRDASQGTSENRNSRSRSPITGTFAHRKNTRSRSRSRSQTSSPKRKSRPKIRNEKSKKTLLNIDDENNREKSDADSNADLDEKTVSIKRQNSKSPIKYKSGKNKMTYRSDFSESDVENQILHQRDSSKSRKPSIKISHNQEGEFKRSKSRMGLVNKERKIAEKEQGTSDDNKPRRSKSRILLLSEDSSGEEKTLDSKVIESQEKLKYDKEKNIIKSKLKSVETKARNISDDSELMQHKSNQTLITPQLNKEFKCSKNLDSKNSKLQTKLKAEDSEEDVELSHINAKRETIQKQSFRSKSRTGKSTDNFDKEKNELSKTEPNSRLKISSAEKSKIEEVRPKSRAKVSLTVPKSNNKLQDIHDKTQVYLEKSNIYSDDSTMDTFEQSTSQMKPTKKGLALLEETLKKESKKKNTSLKFLLNPQKPVEESELSSDLDDDISFSDLKFKKKVIVSDETLKSYEETIEFVVNNSTNITSPVLKNKTFDKQKVDNEGIKSKTLTSFRKIENQDLEDVSDIEHEDDFIEKKISEDEKISKEKSVSDNTEDNADAKSESLKINPFSYDGSAYVVLDNIDENPIEEDTRHKQDSTHPFTYEGMPLPKETVDCCSSLGSGSNLTSPKEIEPVEHDLTENKLVPIRSVNLSSPKPVSNSSIELKAGNFDEKICEMEGKDDNLVETRKTYFKNSKLLENDSKNSVDDTNDTNEMISFKKTVEKRGRKRKNVEFTAEKYNKDNDSDDSKENKNDSDDISSASVRNRKQRKLSVKTKATSVIERKRSRSQRNVDADESDGEIPLKKSRGRKGKERKLETKISRRKINMSETEMKSCTVDLVDLNLTLLKENVHRKTLRKYGISKIRNLKKYFSDNRNLKKSSEFCTDIKNKEIVILKKMIDKQKKKSHVSFQDEANAVKEKKQELIEKNEVTLMKNEKMASKRKESNVLVEDDQNKADQEKLIVVEEEKKTVENYSTVNILINTDDNSSENKHHEKVKKEEECIIDAKVSEVKSKEETKPVISESSTFSLKTLNELLQEKKLITSIQSSQRKEKTLAEAQVIVEKMIIPVKKVSSEVEKHISGTKFEETKPARTIYTDHKGPILHLKVFEDSFFAASDDGIIYHYKIATNKLVNVFKGHTSAVTCLSISCFENNETKKELLYSGSLDGTLRCYDIRTSVEIQINQVGSAIQCLEQCWGTIFIGAKSGSISRYNIKSASLKVDSIQSEKPVMALKATNEGARRVLIVASRNQKLIIRDAVTGLVLRTISGQKNYTIYSLLRDQSLIYCGTSSTSIPVFDFISGEQVVQYNAAGVGIVCMCMLKHLLFAGCYDGNIYVFNTKNHSLLCKIPGTGEKHMILSMELTDKKIIAGSKQDKNLHVWEIPEHIKKLLEEKS